MRLKDDVGFKLESLIDTVCELKSDGGSFKKVGARKKIDLILAVQKNRPKV